MSKAATLRQASRCRASKDTLTSKEGHWEQEPQFIFRVHLDLVQRVARHRLHKYAFGS
jgi:hypothetical protein